MKVDRRWILLLSLLSILAAACAPQTAQPAATDEPAPTAPAATGEPAATPSPEAEAPAVTPVPKADLGATETYRDEFGGYELDYPAGWSLVDVDPEIRETSLLYTVTIFSWEAENGGSEGIPAGGTKVDITVRDADADTFEAIVAGRKLELASSDVQTEILSEDEWLLDSGLRAMRLHVESSFGEAIEVVVPLGEKVVLIGGLGDFDLAGQIASTLRAIR